MCYRIRETISKKQSDQNDRSCENESKVGLRAAESTSTSEEPCGQHTDKKFGNMWQRIVFEDIKTKPHGGALDVRQAVGIQMKISERERERHSPRDCSRHQARGFRKVARRS